MSAITYLTPGCIGFGPLSGAARAAMWGQFILGEGFSVAGLNIGHVFVVTDIGQATPVYPKPGAPYLSVLAVEATPRGARQLPIEDRWTRRYAYARLPEDYAGQAADAAAIARAMIGTPYSFASYAALAAWRFGMKTPRLEKWIDRRKPLTKIPGVQGEPETLDGLAVRRGARLPCEAICSVLADQAWSLTGKKIMEGVAHQCVTPGALAGRLLTMDGVEWMWPGR